MRGMGMGQPTTTADSVLLIDVVRAALDRTGGQHWAIQPTPTWCQVTPPSGARRKHGWKLHVDEEFRTLAFELYEVTDGLAGPRILSDKQLRGSSLDRKSTRLNSSH